MISLILQCPFRLAQQKVGKGAFVGARAMVLPDVSIAEYAVVGAQSVVTHNVPAFTVVAGNPARVLREQKLMVISEKVQSRLSFHQERSGQSETLLKRT